MNEKMICDCDVIHESVVKEVKSKIPSQQDIKNVTYLFKLLAEDTRMKLMLALSINEMCVCDLSVLLNMTKSAISHQLSLLKDAKLIKPRREGKNVFYSLDDKHVQDIVEEALIHTKH